MTYKEAIKYAKGVNFCAGCDKPQFADNSAEICEMCEHRQFFEKVIDALEKQIPKKPNRTEAYPHRLYCPVCFTTLCYNEEHKTIYVDDVRCCFNCSQAIDWSDE